MTRTESYHVVSFIKDDHGSFQLDAVRPAALWSKGREAAHVWISNEVNAEDLVWNTIRFVTQEDTAVNLVKSIPPAGAEKRKSRHDVAGLLAAVGSTPFRLI